MGLSHAPHIGTVVTAKNFTFGPEGIIRKLGSAQPSRGTTLLSPGTQYYDN